MSNIEKQVLDLGTMPTKGIDYWTPEEEAEMSNAKNGALVAAQEARTAKQETDAATDRANEAATNADGAAGVAREEAGRAERSATNADDATVNANRAAADANRAYNTVTNYHDTVTVPDHNRAEQDHTRAEQDHTRHVEDHQEAVNQRAAEAAEFQRTQQEKQAEFARTEKARQDEFDSKEEHRDWANAEAVKFADTLSIHDRAISPYSKSNPLPLTHNLATGSILAMEGDMVVLKAQDGWGITRIDREEFGALGLASGDTLLLPMAHFDQEGKPTDNLMLVGAVLFAAEEAVKGQSGEVLYTRRTSLFRATDNAIATWGGVKKWLAIADNESLLICHPLDITSATITRNGNDAANAAADLNQRRRIEEKLNLGGKDPRAWVGMADQLAPSEKTEQAAYRDEVLPAGRILGYAPELGPSGAGTRDGQIADSVSPVMREVSGVSGGSGQMFDDSYAKTKTERGVTWTDNGNGIYTLSGTSTQEGNINFNSIDAKAKHTYMLMYSQIESSVPAVGSLRLYNNNSSQMICEINASTRSRINVNNADGSARVYFNFGGSVGVTFGGYVIPLVLDLTLLPQLPTPFVASLREGASDAHRVAHALGFLALQRD